MQDTITRTYVQLTSSLDDLTTRLEADEEGQTAAEYVGIIVVVAAIIAVLASSDIGQNIVNGINSTIQRIVGS